jgi:hypothetical protein
MNEVTLGQAVNFPERFPREAEIIHDMALKSVKAIQEQNRKFAKQFQQSYFIPRSISAGMLMPHYRQAMLQSVRAMQKRNADLIAKSIKAQLPAMRAGIMTNRKIIDSVVKTTTNVSIDSFSPTWNQHDTGSSSHTELISSVDGVHRAHRNVPVDHEFNSQKSGTANHDQISQSDHKLTSTFTTQYHLSFEQTLAIASFILAAILNYHLDSGYVTDATTAILLAVWAAYLKD